MYRLNQVKLNIYHGEEDFKKKIAKTSGVSVGDIDWSTLIILHKSIDARDKKNILFVYNVAFDFVSDIMQRRGDALRALAGKLEKYEPINFNPIVLGSHSSPVRDMGSHSSPVRDMSSQCDGNKSEGNICPVVVGFGPAGIFAAYILALNGLKPIVVERGKSLDDRVKDVDKFFKTLELDENSNVCFGEGGAGAFSDGKLNTNNKDKTGIYHFVLETFVKFGADKKILYENMPHIGTDKLVGVIKNIREEIIKLGGEIHYNTKLTFKDGLAQLARTSWGSQCFAPTDTSIAPTDTSVASTITKDTPIILAIGNSSRDTFRELIENGFDVKAKAIAVGYRVAHRQSLINNAQYGEGGLAQLAHTSEGSHSIAHTSDGSHSIAHTSDGSQSIANTEVDSRCVAPVGVSNVLGPATYKLTYDVGNGHSVYSFCMCPGGYIINSSNFNGKLSINGMSYNDRSGKYANSAIVETITPDDVAHIVRDDDKKGLAHTSAALKMIEFQERVEQAAFELEKGFIPYVTSDGKDICHEDVFKGQAKQCEKLKSVFENCGLRFDINKDIDEALKHFNKIIPGFFGEGLAQLARTSEGSQCVAPTETAAARAKTSFAPTYLIAGVETRTSSPVKLDRDENYMCNVPNFYPCGEGLGHGGGIMSCAVDGIKVAISIINKYKK